jgi:hypothetical protein
MIRSCEIKTSDRGKGWQGMDCGKNMTAEGDPLTGGRFGEKLSVNDRKALQRIANVLPGALPWPPLRLTRF